MLRLLRQDSRYRNFPLALSAITVSSFLGSMWLQGIIVPAWMTLTYVILWTGISTYVAWYLLLGKDSKKKE